MIDSFDEATQCNATLVDTAAASASELHDQARQLLATARRFRPGTRARAEAMVAEAVAFIEQVGLEAACREFTFGESFKELDLYVVVYDFYGRNLAQGANPSLLGKDLMEMQDANGVFVVRELIAVAQDRGHGWVENYSYENPVTGEQERKSMFVQKVQNVLVGCGVYRTDELIPWTGTPTLRYESSTTGDDTRA